MIKSTTKIFTFWVHKGKTNERVHKGQEVLTSLEVRSDGKRWAGNYEDLTVSIQPPPPKKKENWAPLFRWIPFISYPWGSDIIWVNRRVSVSDISLRSRRICWVSALVVISRLRTISMFLRISVILARPDRGLSKKRFVSLTTLARRGIPLLRSLLTVVLTNSINWSTDFVSLQRSGPSAVASMLGSHAVKHSTVIWK